MERRLHYDVREAPLTEDALAALLALSRDWEAEGSCTGYRANVAEDLAGCRVFLAEADGRVLGYLFGRHCPASRETSVMPEGTPCFEVEELYVRPECRSRGVGAALFRHAETAVRGEDAFIVLSTATKNRRAILHFYIDELGMDFWSARLYKPL